MKQYREAYDRWCSSTALSPAEQKELAALTEQEIEDRFFSMLEFGTAGLRGRRGGAARPCRAPSGHPTRPEYRLAPSGLECAGPYARLSAPSTSPRAAPPCPLRTIHRPIIRPSAPLSLSIRGRGGPHRVGHWFDLSGPDAVGTTASTCCPPIPHQRLSR